MTYDFSSQSSCKLDIMVRHKSEDLRQKEQVQKYGLRGFGNPDQQWFRTRMSGTAQVRSSY
ncbi:hypothetical protein C8N40_103118 [Pontibacter mucosus]|uniref:Uncharacterized protein n=1 Tax=Pontibacter mucosus TaxID=1649266 RepID=A0A2T5YL46_9BACT|nr:hypothetical protein C8N40_103118 [Pontibacter mucosus]